MKLLGLITEYNPFHNGHYHHLNESKIISGASHSVAIMSGHFTQRGEPGLIDKWTRASMAVSCGVDLVLELPTIYACSSADFFARGSILLLQQLGCITDLCFGSESGTLDEIDRISDILANPSVLYHDQLKAKLNEGSSYPAAQEAAVKAVLKDKFNQTESGIENVFNRPNNVLGIAYLKHLKIVNSSIHVHTIKRIGAGYHDININNRISSASGIRNQIQITGEPDLIKKNMPDSAHRIMLNGFKQGRGPVFMSDFEQAIITLLKRASQNDFLELPHVTEGIDNRMLSCRTATSSIEDFIACVKNKRIPYSRIQRMLTHLLLGVRNPFAHQWYSEQKPPYARILAFNDRGRDIIRLCKKTSSIPLINKPAHFKPESQTIKELLALDYRSGRLYGSVLQNNQFRNSDPDLIMSPVYISQVKPRIL